MAIVDNECLFRQFYGSECTGGELSTNRDNQRILSIIKASEVRNDTLHDVLTPLYEENNNLKVQYHLKCVSKYCSVKLEKKPPKKRQRRSSEGFDFKTKCFYCGHPCTVVRNEKHPERWKPAYLTSTTDHFCEERKIFISQKQYIQERCSIRNDEWGEKVLLRSEGILTDVVAADLRYHSDCKRDFFSKIHEGKDQVNDLAFLKVIKLLTDDKSRIWNSTELYEAYTLNNDKVQLDKKTYLSKLVSKFNGSLISFHSRGYARIFCFEDHARCLLKETKDNDNVDLTMIGKQINDECKECEIDQKNYNSHIDFEISMESTSDTLQELLECISPKFHNSLYGALIGNIVTSIVQNCTTPLQLALGTLFIRSKSILNHLYEYRVTGSYDELLRFKKSAAVHSAKAGHLLGVPDTGSLLQVITDNYDQIMHSQNNKLLCHCLATIVTKNGDSNISKITFPRLKKADLPTPIKEENSVQISTYIGPKKPPMPSYSKPLPDEDFLRGQHISRGRSEDIDFKFFFDVATTIKCPEYNGYCTRVNREQGHSIRPITQTVYLPLMNMIPASATTMETSIKYSKLLSSQHGQPYCIYTSDQQLYRIAQTVLWNSPELTKDFYLRLGGMHLLMSYVGSIGSLMAGSGLKEILEKAFSGVPKMLTGKNFPQCVRALRMVVEEILRQILKDGTINSYTDLIHALEDKSEKSNTTKLWVDTLIKPIFLCLRYIRAEREGDWYLHIDTVELMLPLFYAAGHVNYARDALIYLREMQKLPENVKKHFLKGEHTVQHTEGIFNGLWSDMAIETTYMRLGKASSGIVGQAMKPETVKTWAYSMNVCCELADGLEAMRNRTPSENSCHKEEMKGRMILDEADRSLLRKKLENSIDILDPAHHSQDGLVNIVTGKVTTDPKVNVHKSAEEGRRLMEKFESSLPGGFYETIPRTVKTMDDRKGIKAGDKKVMDPAVIYARALAIRLVDPEFDFEKILEHELAPHPTSMFNEEGVLRTCKQKSKLMSTLKVEIPARLAQNGVKAIFLDGCAILWTISWPTNGTVSDYIRNLKGFLLKQSTLAEVYLVFDRYYNDSIKGLTRKNRDIGASRVYQLTADTPLPSRETVLTVTENKVQLIQLIINDFLENPKSLHYKHKLVVTGPDPDPFEISNGIIKFRSDLRTFHEEADTILIHQVSLFGSGKVIVVADDTDVFVLLVHFIFSGDIKASVVMQPTSCETNVIDINATVEKHADIASNLLAAHALSGCDTAAPIFGIGKQTVIKVLKKGGLSLASIGDLTSPLSQCIEEGTAFLLRCYGRGDQKSLTDARKRLWKTRIANSTSTAPTLESLPPTDKSYHENLKRSHLQAAIWRYSLNAHPPDVDIYRYGWENNSSSSCLVAKYGPIDQVLVPDALLKILRCGCKTIHEKPDTIRKPSEPCKTARCSCRKLKISCTTFCECEGDLTCHNPETHNEHQLNEENEEI